MAASGGGRLDDTHIEIHAVRALRVDADGRVGRVRVIGVADRDDERIAVDACVADLTATSASWAAHDQQASATARIVDPTRTFVGSFKPVFALDTLKPEAERRRAFMWVAEIDLLMSPAVPRVFVGRQEVPFNARARYVFAGGDSDPAMMTLTEVTPTAEFEVGVLFVHGIGQQRRSETLSQWSAPLLRWIDAWLAGAADDLARKLATAPLEGWLHRLLVRSSFGQYDLDHVDRSAYANALVDKARAASYSHWREELVGKLERTKSVAESRAPTSTECDEGDEVVRRIDKELNASAVGGGAEFREAYVLDVGARSIEPSSVEMHVEAMAGDGYMLRSRWMLAESHWGESFWAPSFFRFGRWCLLTAPILLVHYIAMSHLRHQSRIAWFASVLALTGAVAGAELAFVLLMILWLVPWERLRAAVLRLQLKLTGVVGDSYVLLEDPVQRRAILDRVQRDLDWLVQRCRSVVVIAHSQGAAVAELVLSNLARSDTDKVHSFATLGAGVQTLSAIEKLSKSRMVVAVGWVALGCAFALGLAAVLAWLGAWRIGAALAVLALVVLLLAAIRATNVHPGRPALLPRAGWLRPWFDFFATKDLVPFGPLLDPQNNGENYRPKEVRNRDSYVSDHVEYWQNPEQVVGPLAREIGRAAGFAPLVRLMPDDDAVFDRLERARISRLGFMRFARAAILLATALLLYAQWPAWLAVGRWVLAAAPSLVGGGPSSAPLPGVAVWLQALVVVLPYAIHASLVNATFEAWTTAEVERLLRRSAGSPATHWAATFTLLVALTLMAAVDFVWPVDVWPLVAGATAAAFVLAWLARYLHRTRVGALIQSGSRPANQPGSEPGSQAGSSPASAR